MNAAACSTVRDAACRLNVRPARVYELIRLGWLPVVRIGRQVRIADEVLAQFIARGGRPLDAVAERRVTL